MCCINWLIPAAAQSKLPYDSKLEWINPNIFAGLVGKVQKNYLPKEEGREGGKKMHAQRAHRARGSNPGPVAC